MEVLHPTALLAEPNMCIICEETPRPDQNRVVDTGRTMIAPFSDNVWTKYVCEKCGLEIANRLGYVSNEQAKVAFHAAEVATSRLDEVRARILAAAEDIHAFATDVVLGNERSSVGKTVEGDYVETPASAKKAPAGRKKAAESEPVTAGPA